LPSLAKSPVVHWKVHWPKGRRSRAEFLPCSTGGSVRETKPPGRRILHQTIPSRASRRRSVGTISTV
jgi:hypothetical protein